MILRQIRECALIILLVTLTIAACGAIKVLAALETVPAMVDVRLSSIQADTKQEIDDARNEVSGQLTGIRRLLLGAGIQADQRADEALDIVRETSDKLSNIVELEGDAANQTLADSLTGKSGLVSTANNFLNVYASLPGEIQQDRIFKAYEAQGLGTLAATKVFMGDAAKAGRTLDTEFPMLLGNVTELTGTADHTAATVDKAVTDFFAPPKGFMGHFDKYLGLATGGAKVYGSVR